MQIEQFLVTPIYKNNKCVGVSISTETGDVLDADIYNSSMHPFVDVYLKLAYQ